MKSSVVILAVFVCQVVTGAEWWENTWGNNNNGNQRTRYQCWSAGRYVPENSQIDRGKYWYTCKMGKQEPSGCFDDDNRRINIGDSFETASGYVETCVLGRDGYLQFKLTGCVDRSTQRRYKEDESWEDNSGKFWFICKRITDWHLRSEIGGCMNNGRRVNLGEEVEDWQSETYWSCDLKENGAAAMCCKGCLHNNRKYKIGDQWPEGDFVYYCKLQDGKCQKICIGCQSPQGEKLYDGDRYFRDQAVYQCDIRQDHNAHRLVGCVQRDQYGSSVSERVIGCRWYEEKGVHALEKTCEEKAGVATTKVLGCIYKEDGVERLLVPPNMFTIYFSARTNYNKIWVACEADYDGSYTIRELAHSEIDHTTRTGPNGIQYTPPRG